MDFMKRQRGRGRKPGGSGGGGNQGNRPFESNGPDNVKIRGNASQIYEKYMQYARDAQSSGDRVKSENMLQHAEHYFRILSATMPREQRMQQHENAQYGRDEDRDDDLAADGSKQIDDGASDESDDDSEADKAEVRVEARSDDAQGEDDGDEPSEASGDDKGGRGRRRGRRRRPDGDREPRVSAEGRAERPERADPPADREARSALDALAHRQAAVAGN